MAIDIYDLYLKTLQEVNSHQAGFLPVNAFVSWVHEISMTLFAEKVAEYGKNQKNQDELSPFMKTVNLVITPLPGKAHDIAPYPPQYAHHAASRVMLKNESGTTGCLCKNADVVCEEKVYKYEDPDIAELKAKMSGDDLCERSLEKIDNQRWGDLCADSFKKPTAKKPKVTQFEGGFKVMPKGLGVFVMDYFIEPTPPVLMYTTGSQDEIIYNQGASTQLQWGQIVLSEFISRLKEKFGGFTRDSLIYQMAAAEK